MGIAERHHEHRVHRVHIDRESRLLALRVLFAAHLELCLYSDTSSTFLPHIEHTPFLYAHVWQYTPASCSLPLQSLHVFTPIGENRFPLLKSLFSLTFRPPDSVVFRAPSFHGSGQITRPSFF